MFWIHIFSDTLVGRSNNSFVLQEDRGLGLPLPVVHAAHKKNIAMIGILH